MKKLMMCFLASVLFLTAASAQYRDARSGFDGDFFSLEGAIELFKNSRTLQEFERRLNSRDSWVNNLDLDYDGRTDYVRVEHRRQGDFHAIILQVPINRYDLQDIAVIEIEQTGRREALLQIIGDEYLYGDQVIVEPFDVDVRSDGWGGPNVNESYVRTYINVFYWPIVNSFFDRRYQIYVSPYRWSYYPTYWQPWRPCTWDIFRPRIVVFRNRHRVVNVHRVQRVHNFYRPNRRYSSNVFRRTNEVRVKNGRQPHYRANEPRYTGNNKQRNSNNRVNPGRNNSRNSAPGNRGNVNTRSNNRNTDRGANSRAQSSDRGRNSAPRASSNSRANSNRNSSTRANSGRVQSTPSRNNGKAQRNSTSTQRSNSSASKSRNVQGQKQSGKVNRSSSRVSKNKSTQKSTSNSKRSIKR